MTTFTCPNCNRVLKVIPLAGDGGGWERGQAFALGAPPGAELTRETPTGQADTVESGVKVPLLQAAITGTVAGVVSVIPAVYYDWPGAVPPVVAIGTFGLSWWLLLQDTRRLLRRIEVWTGKDLDDDGAVGDPAFTVEIVEGNVTKYARFPAKPAELRKFAQAATTDRLTPEGAGLSRRKFNAIRAEAIARGLVTWRNSEYHAQGLDIPRGGLAAFEQILSEL